MSIRQIDWSSHAGKERAYLGVDAYLQEMVGARALSTALEIGLIDYLLIHPSCSMQALQTSLQQDLRGSQLLAGMLRAHGILEAEGNIRDAATCKVRLTDGFKETLAFRDLMEAKLYFATLVGPDYLQLFTALLMEPDVFFERARLFNLFSYQSAFESTPENLEKTARWMRITTMLTRYEAQACAVAFDFSKYGRMLDVGGNSGEFVLQACRTAPMLKASVYDLPVVCDIGTRHVSEEREASRISFIKVNRDDPALPWGYDLISFKSMLHDWPEARMVEFLQRAYDALDPGGTIMIFERSNILPQDARIGFGQLPLMMFFRSYRSSQAYQERLESIGFHSVDIATIPLDMDFVLITAIK